MDIREILFLLIFIGLPLVTQLLEHLRGGKKEKRESPLDLEAEAGHRLPEHRGPPPVEEPELEKEPWSADWGEWPDTAEEQAVEISSEGVVEEEQARELRVLQERLDPETHDEAARVSAPVVSMERLYVDRPAEHARLHRRIDGPLPRRVPSTPRVAALLRDREELRRAILVSEVLGPPRSLE